MQTKNSGPMLKHDELWRAIDELAAIHRLSPSGLARRAGLDPTTFNKSKRRTKEGKQRWPSTESVAKILNATGSSLQEFVGLIGGQNGTRVSSSLPLYPFGENKTQFAFDRMGQPLGDTSQRFNAPGITSPGSFAIKITGTSFQPTYRSGDILIASPLTELEQGCRALLRIHSGPLVLREIIAKNDTEVIIRPVNRNGNTEGLRRGAITHAAKIVWASQ